jgi:uncharacterized membrane protein
MRIGWWRRTAITMTDRSPLTATENGKTAGEAWPLCNRDPGSAPCWRGHRAPLCWRCCALSLGIVAGHVAGGVLECPPVLGLVLLLPCVADGWSHHMHGWRSSNLLRVATGLPAGFVLGAALRFIH